MKRILFFFLLAITLFPVLALADCSACPAGAVCICNPLSYDTFEELVGHITDFLATIAVVVAPVLIVWAGFLFVTSGGRPEQITKAKTILFWTIVGFSVVWLSRAFIEMIKQILGIVP